VPLSANAISPENVGRLKPLATVDGVRPQHIAFAPDGRQVAASSSDLSFFELPRLTKLSTLSRVGRWFDFAPNGKRLVVGDYGGMAVYQVDGGGGPQPFAASQDVNSVAFSPDGALVASVSGQTVKVWEAASGKVLRTLPTGTSQADVAFSPDGKRLASAGGVAGGEIMVWDTGTWQSVYTLKGHSNWITCLTFAPDGQTLASGASDHSIRLWDLTTGLLARTIPIADARGNQLPDLAFSPDGRLLASSYGVPEISIWEVATGTELRTLTGPTSMTQALAFSPDGAFLATGDDALRLWGLAP
jgi:sugar lactone lactonase YvrE